MSEHRSHGADGAHASFDERAATWDDDPAKVDRAERVAAAVRRAVPLARSMRVLEYGAGTGLVTQALRDAVGPLTLADTSAGMREVLHRKVGTGAIPDARVWDLDLATQPPPDERFDLVVTVMVLHHLADVGAVLAAFHRLLESGGHLCVADLEEEDGSFHGEGFEGHRGFAPAELASQLEGAGFADVRVEPCGSIERDGATYPMFLATCIRRACNGGPPEG